MRREKIAHGWTMAKRNKSCYLFLAPYAILFFTFFILPICTSMYYSFTYYNILEAPRFIGFQNYINLILQDEVFLTAVKNTFVCAVIIGPVGYILSFLFAWFINELPKWLRAVAVIIFYVPSIGGAAFNVFSIIFRADAYGWFNSILLELGFINAPQLWLLDPRYMMTIVIVVSLWMSMGTGFLSFVAGFQGIDRSMYEAGYVDGVRNRWQELYHITLPSMKPMLLFGAVMSITSSFNVGLVPRTLCGFPSTDYAVRTVVTHLFDYGYTRFEMGYASAIAVILFLAMILSKKIIVALLGRVGT
uniref:Putative ABC-type sugar transport system, permease component n=1 Tax=uncultured bacterium Contig33 TaxID=1393553 RepID=W0FQA9_9BACT|nr:putative ABC-type sugar transport system, permease component [uncultured bacterium Contig33]